jgi:hypothetical protein
MEFVDIESFLNRMSSLDLISTRIPTQGDRIPLVQGASTVSQQEDLVLPAPVSSLGLECSSSGVSLGMPTKGKGPVPSKYKHLLLGIMLLQNH